MANTIRIKNSGVMGNTPASLEYGELAINYADEILYYKNSANTIIPFDLTTVISTSEVTNVEIELAMQICG